MLLDPILDMPALDLDNHPILMVITFSSIVRALFTLTKYRFIKSGSK